MTLSVDAKGIDCLIRNSSTNASNVPCLLNELQFRGEMSAQTKLYDGINWRQ